MTSRFPNLQLKERVSAYVSAGNSYVLAVSASGMVTTDSYNNDVSDFIYGL